MLPGVLFLDRDGVLNEKAPEGCYITTPYQLRMLPGAAASLAVLSAELPGLRIAIVTNQRGIARSVLSWEALEAVHAALHSELAAVGVSVDHIAVCPHDVGQCDCRKPDTGLIRGVLEAWPDATAARSAMVGDSAVDIIAGHRLGMRTFLVGEPEHRSLETMKARGSAVVPDEQAQSLAVLVEDGRLTDWLRNGRVT